MATLRVALAQTNPILGELDANRQAILDVAERAETAGADLVVFPELALSGYPPEDLLLRPHFLEDCRRALDDLAANLPDLAALIGVPDTTDGRACNGAALIRGDRVVHVYHKVELPNYGVFDEKRYFGPGRTPLPFECGGARVSVTICEDVWVEDGLAEWHAMRHAADVVVNLSASPFHAGKSAVRRRVLGGFARRTGAVLCYANLVGGQDELVFDGGSLVIEPGGRQAASGRRFEEDLLVVDVDANARTAGRADSGAEPEELDETEEIRRALVLGARDYVRKNGFEKAVIGLSGGIDSSVTAALAVDALGPANVLGVTMPSQYTSSETLADAERLAARLTIPLITIPIRPVFRSYLDALAGQIGSELEGSVTAENLQARIRGNLLMALSNDFGWIVLTTGNKSETAVGYCTLYGDMAGGFSVLKDVPKATVFRLARRINEHAGRELIPRSVLKRPPSAELKPDQRDTDTLPPYPVLDRVLRMYVEEDASPEEIVAIGFSRDVVEKVVRLVDRNEYKRRQAPPGVKITPKAFGRDRRLPITNRYRAVFQPERRAVAAEPS
jgi:NAD+ synthase (glutamine-hydrolysing)